jgi:hypothetical protein
VVVCPVRNARAVDNSRSTHFWRVPASTIVALLVLAFAAAPVYAWTLLKNNFGDDANNPGNPNSCTDVDPYWCIEWPLQNGHSSSVFVYLSGSLHTNNPGETVDLKQQARNAFAGWNDVPAFSPYLFEAATLEDATGIPGVCAVSMVRAGLPAGVMARTFSFSEYDRLGAGSKKKYVCFQTVIAQDVNFDTDSDPDDGFKDARWTMGHELGHGLSLGHTAFKALMYPIWPNSKYMGITPTANDIDGLQFAYGQP